MPPQTHLVPGITVLICCYTHDRLDQLSAGIRAAQAQLRPAVDELIVIVDHNESLRTDLVAAFPAGITVIPNVHLSGLSGARNTGVDTARGEIVVFLDDDATLRRGALDTVRTAFADTKVIAVGGAVHAQWEAGQPSWFPDEFGWVVGCDYRGLAADGSEIRNPIGAAMAVRRVELQKIGGFSDRLGRVGTVPAGCEETLMGIELRTHFPDSKIVRLEPFAVDHFVPRSRSTLRYFTSRCRHEGRSKAILSEMVGSEAGLAAERSYVVRTLSTGVGRYLRGSVTGNGFSELSRILVMILGLLVTASAHATAMLRRRSRTEDSGSAAPELSTEPAITPDELVTVVIPTVGRDSLFDTVRTVLSQSHGNIELLVVDNRPHRGLAARLLAAIDDARLSVLEQPIPGVSAARNKGHHGARGRIVAFTDDDALPDSDWISGIVHSFHADETGSVGIVTGRVLGTESTTREQAWFEEAKVFDKGDIATVWAMNSRKEVGLGTDGALGEYGPHGPFFPYTAGECGSGNNMAFRSSALHSIGGFDERLGTGTPTHGGEDLDAFRATLLAGWAIAYNPNAVVRHYHRDNMPELRVQSYGYGTGMAASLTKFILSGSARPILTRVPRGIHMLISPTSTKNADFPSDWPTHLRVLEAVGYLTGPALFVRSHLHARRVGTRR